MNEKERYYYRKENGICVRCGKNPARPNRTRCEKCAEIETTRVKEDRAALIKMGICPRCRKNPIVGYERMCEECRKKFYEYKNTHGIPNIKSAYQVRKESGICVNCGTRKAVKGKTQCATCAKKNALRMRNRTKIKNGFDLDRSERISYGLCYFCGKPAILGYKVCEEHRKMCERNSRTRNAINARRKLIKEGELY